MAKHSIKALIEKPPVSLKIRILKTDVWGMLVCVEFEEGNLYVLQYELKRKTEVSEGLVVEYT